MIPPERHFCLALAVAVLIVTKFGTCGPDKNIHNTARFKNIPAALNYLHILLPNNTSLNDRCVRYADLLSKYSLNGIPYISDVSRVATEDSSSVYDRFRKIDERRLILSYMSAIDVYRITELGPALLDLVECLRLIDTPATRDYLANEELNVLVDLYRLILGRPDVESLDTGAVNLKDLRPRFCAMLKMLFKDYLNIDCDVPIAPNRRRKLLDAIAHDTENVDTTDQGSGKKTRRLRLRQQRYRERHLLQERERSLLKQQRWKLLNPDTLRDQARVRQQRKRDRSRTLPPTTSAPKIRRTRMPRRIGPLTEREHKRLVKRRESDRKRRQEQQLRDLQQAVEKVQQAREKNLVEVESLRHQQASTDPWLEPETDVDQVTGHVDVQQQPLDGSSHQQEVDLPLAHSSFFDTLPLVTSTPSSFHHSLIDTRPPMRETSVHNEGDRQLGHVVDWYLSDSQDHDYCYRLCNQIISQGETSNSAKTTDLASLMSSFEPESLEERQIHQDLINCANQMDDIDTMIQFIPDANARNMTGSLTVHQLSEEGERPDDPQSRS